MERRTKRIEPKSYPNLRRYLRSQFLDATYLTYPRSNALPWRLYLSTLMLTICSVKYAAAALIPDNDNMSYYIGDASLIAGSSRRFITIIWSIWSIAALTNVLTLLRSERDVKLQKWVYFGKLFEEPRPKVVKLFQLATRLNITTAGIGSAFGNLTPAFFWPWKFVVYIAAWTLVHTFGILMVAGNMVNMALLFGLYVYIYSQRLNLLITRLNTVTEMDDQNCSKFYMKFVGKFILNLKEIVNGCQYWTLVNQTLFIFSFFAQFLILYIIFFVDIPSSFRYAQLGFEVLNFICGQSTHFFIGIYGQRKINKCCKRMRQALATNIRFEAKLSIMNVLDEVEKRYFYMIFNSLAYSSQNFIIVALENISYLFLVISTRKVRTLT